MVAPTLRRRSKMRKQGNECKMTRGRPSWIVARACAKRDREVHLLRYLDLERKEPDRADATAEIKDAKQRNER
jgi:hypothetical protein